MRGDDLIYAECLKGSPDWREIGMRLGISPDEALERSVLSGAFWLKGIDPEHSRAARRELARGGDVDSVARALGTDAHAALIWVGLSFMCARRKGSAG